jgi:hypothetical protein
MMMRRCLWIGGTLLLMVPLAAITTGCGGDGKKVDDASTQAPDDDEPTEEEINEMMSETGLQFDEEAAEIVLKRGARKVSDCLKQGAVEGEGEITAIFDGPKGRIIDVELGYTFEDGSDQGQKCIKNSFIGEIIPPFEGTRKKAWPIVVTSEPVKKDDKKDGKKDKKKKKDKKDKKEK